MIRPVSRPLLEIVELESWFQTPSALIRAVDNVSLQVGERQAIGVVGESGSGKTQTFFSAFGLTSGWPGVVAGRVRFDDTELLAGLDQHVRVSERSGIEKNSSRWNAIHRQRLLPILGHDVAMMSQDPRRSLIPYWTVGRHLMEVMQRRATRPLTESDAHDLLGRFGFRKPERLRRAYPEQLSGGEAQRVMLALTTAMAPRLLIADEPTTALDAVNQIRVLEELRRLHTESNVALVLISHDLGVVAGMVEYLLVFFGGRILERAPASVLGDDAPSSLHPYTVELLESQRRRSEGLPIAASVKESTGSRLSAGCPYATRCSLRPRLSIDLQVQCESVFPDEVELEPNHFVACWGVTS